MPLKMRKAVAELGYDGDPHRSQAITKELVDWADIIVCMGNVHENYINQHYPEHSWKAMNWQVKDPHFAQGDEEHKSVAKQIRELVFHHFD